MLELTGSKHNIRIWKKQRAKYGFSMYDTFEIDTWFLKTIPDMLDVLIKNNQCISNIVIDEYLEKLNIEGVDTSNISDEDWEKYAEDTFKIWTNILIEMKHHFLEADSDTCSFKNKYEKEYQKALQEYQKEYGWFGEKKHPEIMTRNADGSTTYEVGYGFSDIPKYQEINKLYKEEEKRIEEYNNKHKAKALEMFVKYFDDLCW